MYVSGALWCSVAYVDYDDDDVNSNITINNKTNNNRTHLQFAAIFPKWELPYTRILAEEFFKWLRRTSTIFFILSFQLENDQPKRQMRPESRKSRKTSNWDYGQRKMTVFYHELFGLQFAA
jgi:hypothetical protein